MRKADEKGTEKDSTIESLRVQVSRANDNIAELERVGFDSFWMIRNYTQITL